jgi:imidazolonepropionase
MTSLSIRGADAVLMPPEPGLPYLRHDRAGEQRLEPGSVAVRDGRIAALDDDAGAELRLDASGCTVLPGLVDCHTHLPFAGWRAEEYELKVTGVPYAEISRRGGGIRSSARSLAAASDDEVLAQASGLTAEMLQCGTTAFEGKSGYGLAIEQERRQLVLGAALAARTPQPMRMTGLLAHAVPEGSSREEWLDEVEEALPALLASAPLQALDAFVEEIAFTTDDLRRVAGWAREHGLALRAHVEQLTTMRSVPVAVEEGARSVDHLSRLHPDDVGLLARSECAAVLLPGAEFMNAEHAAPGRALADAGAIAVLATDLNPGTSPILSLPVIAGLGVRRYGWSALEAALAMTLNAAWVLDLHRELGSVEVGKRADLVLLDGPLTHLAYRFGRNPVVAVVIAGEVAWMRAGDEHRVGG